jgi:hypothetical protein
MQHRLVVLSSLILGAYGNFYGSRGQASFLSSSVFGHAPSTESNQYVTGRGALGKEGLGETFARFASSEVDMSSLEAFIPTISNFDALSEAKYTALGHPAYPQHGVRVKKSSFCDGTVE